MAKAKYIKLGNGEEIGLIGMTAERQAEFEKWLDEKQSGVSSVARAPAPAPVAVDPATLPNVAIGINQATDKKTFEVVVVKYDAETKQAAVYSVENVGGHRNDAMNKYKVHAFKLGIL